MHTWDELYASGHTLTPSPFAEFVSSIHPASGTLLDLGCGNGRDSLHLARQGFDVIGLDVSNTAIAAARAAAAERAIDCRFLCRDITELESVQREVLSEREPAVYYGRFIFHSLHDDALGSLIEDLATSFRARHTVGYFEFRTKDDEALEHVFEHDRFYRTLDAYRRLAGDSGIDLTVLAHGTGLAPYKDEDPIVCRAKFSAS